MKKFNFIRTHEWFALLGGIILTIVFLVFATAFYEMIYPGSAEYANEMYNSNMYFLIALTTSVVVWAVNIVYYLILDRFPKFIVWCLFFLVAILLTSIITYYYPASDFREFNLDFSSDLQNLTLVNAAISAIYFFLISLCIKGLSKNCATTPF